MKLEFLPEEVSWKNFRVRDHPVWKNQPRPWTAFKGIKITSHSSTELHYFYNTVKRLGPGLYANLGTFRGRSAAVMAYGLRDIKASNSLVYAVDTYRFCKQEKVREYFEEVDLDDYVKFCKGLTCDWAEKLKDKKFKFILIDADHTYEGCKLDFELWSPLLADGGEIAFHDVDTTTVNRVIQEMNKDEWEQVEHIFKTKTFKRR